MMADVRHTLVRPATHSRRSVVRLLRAIRHAAVPRTAEPVLTDVWSRTQPKYRRRAILLLLINIALFAGLGCFAFWLRTGQPIPFLAADYWDLYWQTFNPTAARQVTLIDFLIAPINAQQAPMQIIVLALLLASFVSIPILMAMLYRLPTALIFVFIIGFVAVFPWLALTITLSCVLTRLRPLQFSFRYATALIALVPVLLYFYNATRSPLIEASYTTPIGAATLYAPCVLAVLASCLVMGTVLLIARLVNYRPGAIAPLMAVMFALPVVLFEAEVGRDELYYRLLENEWGPRSMSHFRDREAPAVMRELAEQKYADEAEQAGSQGPTRSIQDIEREIRDAWSYQLDPLGIADEQLNQFQLDQYRAVQACDRFRDDFPRSRYVPNVLYIKGRTLDMRIDLETFRRNGSLHYYQDFPNQVSASTWATLYQQYPDSPAAAVALYRSAQLDVRAGRIDHALELLDTMIDRFGDTRAVAASAPARLMATLDRTAPTSTLDLRLKDVVSEGRRLRDLIRRNRPTPSDAEADAPLAELFRCDPRHRLYARNLREIMERYPATRLQDNLALEREKAMNAQSASLKIEGLKRFIQVYGGQPGGDAMPEAYYRLGEAYILDNRPADALDAFEEVLRKFPDSAWAEQARQITARAALRGVTTNKAP